MAGAYKRVRAKKSRYLIFVILQYFKIFSIIFLIGVAQEEVI